MMGLVLTSYCFTHTFFFFFSVSVFISRFPGTALFSSSFFVLSVCL